MKNSIGRGIEVGIDLKKWVKRLIINTRYYSSRLLIPKSGLKTFRPNHVISTSLSRCF